MDKNGQKWTKMDKNGQKWTKNGQKCQKCQLVKLDKNDNLTD
jgi:hypothetical protein